MWAEIFFGEIFLNNLSRKWSVRMRRTRMSASRLFISQSNNAMTDDRTHTDRQAAPVLAARERDYSTFASHAVTAVARTRNSDGHKPPQPPTPPPSSSFFGGVSSGWFCRFNQHPSRCRHRNKEASSNSSSPLYSGNNLWRTFSSSISLAVYLPMLLSSVCVPSGVYSVTWRMQDEHVLRLTLTLTSVALFILYV